MKPCSCTLVHSKTKPPIGILRIPNGNTSGIVCESGGSYTHRKRILAEANNTKVQYKGSIANSLPLSPSINCTSNFSVLSYTNNPNCNCRFLY